MEGYFYGILDIYYAPMTTEETSTTAPTYDTPKVPGKVHRSDGHAGLPGR